MDNEQKNLHMYPRDWFYSELPLPFREKYKTNSTQFLRVFYPFSLEYYSRFVPLFSFQLTQLDELDDYEIVTLRDGLIPLLWFFYNKKIFLNQKTFFLVSYKLRKWIPHEWRDKIGLYSVVSTENITTVQKKKVFINGFVFKNFLTYDFLDTFFETILHQWPNLKGMEIEVFFPTYGGASHQETYHNLYRIIEDRLGKITKFWDIEDITWLKYIPMAFKDYYLINLNRNDFLCDDYITHFLLKSGALLLDEEVIHASSNPYVLSLSPEHEVRILNNYHWPAEELEGHLIQSLLKDIQIYFEGHVPQIVYAEIPWPWPYEFMTFIHEYILKFKKNTKNDQG